ncbi:MAG: vitamin K epoxide reductase family protein [Balneolaceae bacterium]|nr:MAG: vitamin K epoxide reductase family protein [Balneolaceae bacterium]
MNRLLTAFIFTAMLGWVASIILTAIHFWVIPIIPSGAELRGPMLVITSSWAYVGPVPLAAIGAVYYIVMIAMGSVWLTTKNELIERILLPVTAFGFVASMGFVYLQFFVIGAICPFCMVSAAATTILLVIELIVKYNGGVALTPSLQPQRVWATVFVTTALLTMFAMWSLTVLPLPVPGA